MTAPSQERVEQGDLNRYPCGCWLRACSEAHERPPAAYDALTEELDRLADQAEKTIDARDVQLGLLMQERDRLRAALEQIEREWGTSMDNTPLIASAALAGTRL